jgi:glycine/D-amino acid oxidase-like deaminating enzyme
MDLDNPMHAGQWDPDKLPATGGTDDYFIEFLFEQMQKSVPGLVQSGLVSSWLSYRAEPRDFLPLLGETPIDGYILATGYGGNGIIEAPAASRDLAKFIMRGETTPLLEDWAFKRLWGQERS